MGGIMPFSILLKNIVLVSLVLIVLYGCESAVIPERQPAAGRWEWLNPKPQGRALFAVWAAPDGIAYAVGAGGTFLRFDGEKWKTLPSARTNGWLMAIWGTSSQNVYAGGDGVLMKYNGRKSSYFNLPTNRFIRSIWGRSESDIYAAGHDQLDAYEFRGIIMHFDGSQWSVVYENEQVTDFSDIMGLPSGEIYAIGRDGIYVNDGAEWYEFPDSNRGGCGIWVVSPENIFANSGGGSFSHYYNGSWTTVELCGYGVITDALWGRSPTEVYAVGPEGSVFLYNGTSWNPMHSATPVSLFSVTGYGDSGIITVGQAGATQHFDGVSWRSGTKGPVADILAVWCSSSNNIYFAGRSDSIYHYDGIEVRGIYSGTNRQINEMWGFSGDTVFAVGSEGSITMFDNIECRTLDSGTDSHLRGVWGTSPSNVYAAGSSDILHYDGQSWRQMDSPGCYFSGVWGSSASNIFASSGIGYDGFGIYRYDGASWSMMEGSDTIRGQNAIHGTSDDNVATSGIWGRVFQFDGESWNNLETNVSYRFYGVYTFSKDKIFVVGGKSWDWDAIMLRFDDGKWQELEYPGLFGTLNDIIGTPDGDVIVVGDYGTVLRYSER